MSTGKKTGGKDIKPGQVLNPNGRPKLSEGAKILMRATSEQVKIDIAEIWSMTHPQLFDLEQNNSISAGKKALASVLNQAIQIGSAKELNLFLDRIIGKVKDQIELSGPDGGPIETESNSTMTEILTLLKAKEADGR